LTSFKLSVAGFSFGDLIFALVSLLIVTRFVMLIYFDRSLKL